MVINCDRFAISSLKSVVFYSPSQVNLELILKLILEHSPGWIIDETRQEWILCAIETRDLAFLRILTQTIEPFINCEYLEFAVGIENNFRVIEYLMSLNFPIDQLKVLTSAVENKAFNNLKFLYQQMEFPIDDNYNLFSYAAFMEDNIDILEYLKLHHCPISHLDATRTAAENGALNNLKWLLENGFSMEDIRIFEAAIASGSLEILKWLKRNKCPIDGATVSRFTWYQNCSIETFEWLLEQGVTMSSRQVFIGAAKRGCLDTLKWLLKKEYSIEHSEIFIMVAASADGSLEIFEWLLKNGCSNVHLNIFIEAARKGHFEVMKWLLKNEFPVRGSEIFVAAAEFGSIEQMKWLFDNDFPLDVEFPILEKAAEKGNVELMEFLLEKGCRDAMQGAAEYGCLTIMEWLLEKGCPINDPEIMRFAVKCGSLHNMKWLFERGCPIDDSHTEIFVEATKHGCLTIMKWLLDNGCPIHDPEIMSYAAEYGSLVNLKWLLAIGCPLTNSEIFSGALLHGSLRNLKWLLENKCPVDEDAKSMAIQTFGSFEKLLQLSKVDPAIVVYI